MRVIWQGEHLKSTYRVILGKHQADAVVHVEYRSNDWMGGDVWYAVKEYNALSIIALALQQLFPEAEAEAEE